MSSKERAVAIAAAEAAEREREGERVCDATTSDPSTSISMANAHKNAKASGGTSGNDKYSGWIDDISLGGGYTTNVFHKSMGFRSIGRLMNVGIKHGMIVSREMLQYVYPHPTITGI